ncbi:hypothetical protein M9H77_05090 [Catharanthus roseus]|uniref:Uncharacterized protein n=1 Tax=Catharanthus roseus TaxID=4058 RepID=A0ACC0CG94_CATRO|nr:hypothetical protein M9H77_05090 [Catharanthus roseus]
MDSGEQIDDLIESDTIRLLDWNDTMADLKLGMRDHTITTYNPREVCKDNGTRSDAYVPDIYLQETYRRTYQSNFYRVGDEDFWRDVPYSLTFYHPTMNNQWSRKQGTRFRGEMDYRNPDFLPNIKNVITPVEAMYKFLFFKVL